MGLDFSLDAALLTLVGIVAVFVAVRSFALPGEFEKSEEMRRELRRRKPLPEEIETTIREAEQPGD
jgi:hypothetical protein